MTPLRLYLHVGHPKTGTTSIQAFLTERRDALRRDGILVPAAGGTEGAHHGLVQNWHAIRGLEDRSGDAVEALHREIRDSGCRAAVVSSEGFIHENPARLAALGGPGVESVLIYYIRRQDLVAESAYAQRVRSFIQLSLETPSEMLPRLTPRYLDILTRLASAFPDARIRVRPFEPAAFQGGALLPDFLSLIGADPARYPDAERRRNTAFKRPYLEFKRSANRLPLLEEEHRALSAELARLSAADPAPYPRHLLGYRDRLAILEACAAENAEIARRFLGRADGRLFTEPPPADDPDFRPFGLPPPAFQHRLLNALSADVRSVLECLDPRIRQRLPDEGFLSEPPSDPAARNRLTLEREHTRLRRRLARLEAAPAEPAKPSPGRLVRWMKRVGNRLLARRSGA